MQSQNRWSAEERAKLVENATKVLIGIDFKSLNEDQGDFVFGCLFLMHEAGIEWNMQLDIEAEAEAAAHQLESYHHDK